MSMCVLTIRACQGASPPRAIGLAISVMALNSGAHALTWSNAAHRCRLPIADSSSSFKTPLTACISSTTTSRRTSIDTLRADSGFHAMTLELIASYESRLRGLSVPPGCPAAAGGRANARVVGADNICSMAEHRGLFLDADGASFCSAPMSYLANQPNTAVEYRGASTNALCA
jgi:hypothetical protein